MDTKWWEYYTVRYFLGSVIGAGVVAFLNAEPGSPVQERLTIVTGSPGVSFLGLGLVAALGFAFCYVASSPMLTVHAARAHLRMSSIKTSPWQFVLCVTIAVLTTVAVLWQFLPLAAAAGTGIVIGFQFSLIVLALITGFVPIESFYRDLATVRATSTAGKDKPTTPGAEYITSYRHLREHGNAVIIVVLELVLAYAILLSRSRASAIILIGVWLLPACFAWLLGTVLESRLVSKPLT